VAEKSICLYVLRNVQMGWLIWESRMGRAERGLSNGDFAVYAAYRIDLRHRFADKTHSDSFLETSGVTWLSGHPTAHVFPTSTKTSMVAP
jgi:hypothetical protein